jgi:hypothetical protein
MAYILPAGGKCYGPGHGSHSANEPVIQLTMPNGESAWLTKDHLWEWFERESDGDLTAPGTTTCPYCGNTDIERCQNCVEMDSCPNCGRDYGTISCDVCTETNHDDCSTAQECSNCGNDYPERCDACTDPRECQECGEQMTCSYCDRDGVRLMPHTEHVAVASSVVDGTVQYEDGVTIQLLED